MAPSWLRLAAGPAGRNTAAAYFVQGAQVLLPLILAPYLARVLGAEAFGAVIFAQAAAIVLAIFIEFGCSYTGARELAIHRDDPAAARRIVSSIVTLKLAAAAATTGLIVVGFFTLSLFRDQPLLLIFAWATAAAQGLTPFWFFQARREIPVQACFEVVGRALVLLLVFTLVSGPEHAWIVLAAQSAGLLVSSGAGHVMMYRRQRFRLGPWSAALDRARRSAAMLLFTASQSVILAANPFVLGLVASSTATVAYFGAAERMVRSALAVFAPAAVVLYPHLSQLHSHNPAQAARWARHCLWIALLIAALLSLLLLFAAAPIVRLFLGEGFGPVVPLLRLMSILPPLAAASLVLGSLWMLPQGMDRCFTAVIAIAAVADVILLVLLHHWRADMGPVLAVILVEVWTLAALGIILLRTGRSPLAKSPQA